MENKLTINELFSGIGAQIKALGNMGINFEVVGISEIDKYAIKSYEAIHGKTFNYGDISKIEKLKYADLWTYSFPCQDISLSGKQQGINENTRSGLLYQVQRLLEVSKRENAMPKYLLLENVKNLVGKKFKPKFDEWIKYLDDLGYVTYWQILNAKDYGMPQNRERVFAISVRKDIYSNFSFKTARALTTKLKDLLEENVDDNYYLTQEQVNNFIVNGNLIIEDPGSNPRFFIKEATKKGYAEFNIGDSLNLEHPNSKTRRGRVGREVAQTITTSPQIYVLCKKNSIIQIGMLNIKGNEQIRRVYSPEGIAPTLNTMQGGNRQPKIFDGVYIRKLTPLECWRLMGFADDDFYKAKNSGVSNSQLYKQAGNSIVVNVLMDIFKNLFSDYLMSEVA